MLIKRLKDNYLSSSRPFLAVGITSFILSTILYHFGPEIGVLAFMEGLFSGISIVSSIIGLYLFGKLKKTLGNEKK